ncbi:DNA-binding pseudobarrel domain superfamily [Arabidopsis suecica]|uniref:DNA-binding pseudobarrel domain superfamily n=1 Tax=Arabidopsis suecica TaxID=45249 RepID=A0A8T2G241_ARASU|nr:DNA-binding pseudobarrel domain superfamily [Arabidopsis suecica]
MVKHDDLIVSLMSRISEDTLLEIVGQRVENMAKKEEKALSPIIFFSHEDNNMYACAGTTKINHFRSKEKRPINVEKRSHKKRKIISPLEEEPIQTTPQEWLLNVMRREENGYNPKLISTRQLYKTDLKKTEARLSVPFKQIRDNGVPVNFVDPELNKHVLELRKWKIKGNWIYVFVKGWKNVLDACKTLFKEDDVYPLGSSRSGTGKLCFALTPKNSGRGNSLPGGDGASTSGESGQVPLPIPPARYSSNSGQGCSGESSSSSS